VIHKLTVALGMRQVGLTDRELEVLQFLTLGLGNADIADRLVLSPRTVQATSARSSPNSASPPAPPPSTKPPGST
jgi:FixJ family two-component response regulator